jgi:hypothetical protein
MFTRRTKGVQETNGVPGCYSSPARELTAGLLCRTIEAGGLATRVAEILGPIFSPGLRALH